MIRRLIFSVAVCLVCVTSRADITNDLQRILLELQRIDSKCIEISNIAGILGNDYYDWFESADETRLEYFIPLCQSLLNDFPDLVSAIHSLRLSVGDQLGNDVFQISSNVDSLLTQLINMDSYLAYAAGEISQMLYELYQIRDFGYSITETIQTISDSIDDDVLANQRRIISLLEDIGTMLNWGSDLQNMAEDLAYIRQVFETYANEVQQRLYHIDTYQRELNTSFTIPFSLSHIPSYTFPFYYAYTTLQSPTSPSDWQIDSTDYIYDGSVNGILEEIGRVLTHILEGDSNASFMLANIVKSLAHEEVSSTEKQNEYMEQVSTPIGQAQKEFNRIWYVDNNGVVQISNTYYTPVNGNRFSERFGSTFDGYAASMRRYIVDTVPDGDFHFPGFSIAGHHIGEMTFRLPFARYSFVFTAIRSVFGFIYWFSFFVLAFYCMKWCIKCYNLLLNITAKLPQRVG